MPEPMIAAPRAARFRLLLSRTARWCFGLSGVVMFSGIPCPCCGQQGCPAGAVGVGLLGAVLAIGARIWKRVAKS